MAKSEDALIRWIASQRRGLQSGVLFGIGDDMAMVEVDRTGKRGAGRLLATVDMLMDGVDFDTAIHPPRLIGRKAIAAGLSDCAAMAVRPRYAMVSVALPGGWSMRQAKELYGGVRGLAAKYGCEIVGGDTNSWRHPLAIDVIVLAEPWADCEPVRRSGMRPGDAVCVTGVLGGSLWAAKGSADEPPAPRRRRASLPLPHHLVFEPQVWEAHYLAVRLGRHLRAMMDISDGLSTDGTRMAAASGCGMELQAAALNAVASESAHAASEADGRTLVDHVLNDGEDFELLFAVDRAGAGTIEELEGRMAATSRGHAARLGDVAERGRGSGLTVRLRRWARIGTAVPGKGLWLRDVDGRRRRLKPAGWEHFKG